MTCKVNIDKNGRVTVSEYKELWDSLTDSYGTNDAVAIMSYAVDDSFKQYNIENPTVSQVLRHIDNVKTQEAKPINKSDKLFALDMSINTRFIDEMLNTFTTEEGHFGYDLNKLQELFPQEQALSLYTEQPKVVEDLYYKIKQGQTMEDMYTSYDINKGENPDFTIEQLEQQFAGYKTREEIVNKAFEEDIDLTEEEIEYILKNLSDKKLIRTYNPDGSIKTYNKTEDVLLQTLDMNQDFRPIKRTLSTLLSLSPVTWIEDTALIEDTLSELEQQAEEIGLDLSALTELMESRSLQEYSLFLDSLDAFLDNIINKTITEEDVTNFAKISDNFFEDYSFEKQTLTDESNYNEIAIEGRITPEEAFDKHSAIKKEGNVYVKVPNLPIEEIKEEIYQRIQPTDGITNKAIISLNKKEILKDIDSYLTKKVANQTNPYSNIDKLKQIEGLKWLYKLNPTEQTVVFPEKEINLDLFETKLYKELLEKPHLFEHIGFSKQGIELLTKGPYTTKLLEIELDNFKELQDYAAVSGIDSLKELVPQSNTQNPRQMYVNNPNQLERFNSPYKKPTDNTVLTTSDNAEFINIDNEIYEKVGPYNYVKVAPFSTDIQYNLSKPKAEITNPIEYLDYASPNKKVNKANTQSIEC